MDRFPRASEITSFEKVRKFVSSNRMNEEDRRALIGHLHKSPLQPSELRASIGHVMGHVGPMASSARCMLWWSAAIESLPGVEAALDCKLPFSAKILDENSRWDLLQLITNKQDETAWLIWNGAVPENEREDLLIEFLQPMGRAVVGDEDRWRAELVRVSKDYYPTITMEQVAQFIADRINSEHPNAAPAAWLEAFFAEGLTVQKKNMLLRLLEAEYAADTDIEEQCGESIGRLLARHDAKELSKHAPSVAQTPTTRRI